jgi:hypothetical protein
VLWRWSVVAWLPIYALGLETFSASGWSIFSFAQEIKKMEQFDLLLKKKDKLSGKNTRIKQS